ncbi:HEAT repeat domain-containing protein [Nodosilinea sp. LEGE 07298]|uniref:HEAT repeat domain-containing protein n=1 Tax=Nodosilinea sp. LEGE 07298 TaxID=2777970 RepID=UPI00187ED2FC|nr:HEAT repeat domain-containing protein [Nodosilinea sp. LEGE 07298]MBE9109265.1 HEAT repeat domain-containing protein [Nodosilinea sp. LEGE 07298]
MTGKALPRFITSIVIPGFLLGSTTISAVSQTPTPAPAPTTAPASPTLRDDVADLWQEHRLFLIFAGLVLLLGGGGYAGVLWLKPLWLLQVPSQDLAIPWTTWKVPLGMVRWFKYRDRVLDTWITQHWRVAQQAFLNLPSVENRAIHLPLPVRLDEDTISELTGAHLVSTFQKKTVVLLICGEGGAGKTSLACQIAQWGLDKQLSNHRMIPVLIETELDNEREDLLAAIQGRINILTDQQDPIDPEFLTKLLQRQRVLVIVDHLSEMGGATRSQINPQLANFPAKALVVTSRLEEPLGGLSKTVVKPLQLEANRLWPFMSAYLAAKGKPNLFVDDEFANGSDRLRRMAGERGITVLLARMYIDQMIREREGAGAMRPDSVPKLMLSYLNQLNLNIEPDNKRDDLEVQHDAKLVAWECLKQTYRPTWVKKVDAIAALDTLEDGMPAKERLDYLEKRLQFLKAPEPGDSIRIILDPLAEYLAAAYLVERTSQKTNPEAEWQQFFLDIDCKLENDTPDIIRGFLLAVRDYCLDNANDDRIPKDLPNQLALKANISPDEIARSVQRSRVRRLIDDLSWPDPEVCRKAILELGSLGTIASPSIPKLVDLICNKIHVDDAGSALVSIGSDAVLPLAKLLASDVIEERSSSISLLRRFGVMAEVAVPEISYALINDESPEIRWNAAISLAKVGIKAEKALPSLVQALEDDELAVCNWSAFALGRLGSIATEAIPNLIAFLEGNCQKDFSVLLAAGEALIAIGFNLDDLEIFSETGEREKAGRLKILLQVKGNSEEYHGTLRQIILEYRQKRKSEKEKEEKSRPPNTLNLEWQPILSAGTPPQEDPLPSWL